MKFDEQTISILTDVKRSLTYHASRLDPDKFEWADLDEIVKRVEIALENLKYLQYAISFKD